MFDLRPLEGRFFMPSEALKGVTMVVYSPLPTVEGRGTHCRENKVLRNTHGLLER